MSPEAARKGVARFRRTLDQEARERDLLEVLADHLAAHPMGDPFTQVDALVLLRDLNRRHRR